MILTIVALSIFTVLSFYSTIHALGLWLALLITHGVFVLYLGDAAIHLPMYSGIVITAITLMRRKWHGVSGKAILLFGGLGIIMLLTTLTGMDLDRSLITMLLYGKAFLLALLVAGCVRSEDDIRIMMTYCLVALVSGALVTLYQYATDTFVISNIYKQRAAGLRADPNDTAMLLVAGVPIAMYWFYNARKNVYRLLALVSLPLLLAGVVLTASRSGFLTLVIVAMILYFRRPTIPLTALGIVMLLMVAVLAPQSYWDRIKTLTTATSTSVADRSIASRAVLFKEGTKIFFNNPVIGVGPGNFSKAFYASKKGSSITINDGNTGITVTGREKAVAHNMYLEFFVENGVFGGLLFLTILYVAMKNLLRYDHSVSEYRHKMSLGFTLAVVLGALLFAGMFLSQGKNSVLWFMVGLGLAAHYVGYKNRQANKKSGTNA